MLGALYTQIPQCIDNGVKGSLYSYVEGALDVSFHGLYLNSDFGLAVVLLSSLLLNDVTSIFIDWQDSGAKICVDDKST